MFDSLNKNELNWHAGSWTLPAYQEVFLPCWFLTIPVQENCPVLQWGGQTLQVSLFICLISQMRKFPEMFRWIDFEQLICILFEMVFVEWSLEFLKKVLLLSIVMVYCRLMARGRLCSITFMVMKRAVLFTGVCTKQYSKCFLYICSFNPKNRVR